MPDSSCDKLLGGNHDSVQGPTISAQELSIRRRVLALFTLVNFITYFDRGAIAGCLDSIRDDSTICGDQILSDTKSGFLVSAFMVGFMIAAPGFTAMGGIITGKQIIFIGLCAWAVACVSTAMSHGYVMLLLSRMCVGVGEAAYAGFFVTILDNIAPKAVRTKWIGLFFSMIPFGQAVGMGAGGVLASDAGIGSIPGWRVCFVAEVIPMIPLVILVGMLPERFNPVRSKEKMQNLSLNSATDGVVDGNDFEKKDTAVEHVGLFDALKQLATNASYCLVVFGYGMYTFVVGAIALWAIPMLVNGPMRLSNAEASVFMGLSVAFTGLVGSLVGGIFVDILNKKSNFVEGQAPTPYQRAQYIFYCSSFDVLMIMCSLPCGLICFFMTDIYLFFFLFIAAVFLIFTVTAPVNSSILTLVDPKLRTYAISFSVFFMHALGDFPSPAVSGVISDSFDNGCKTLTNSTCEANPEQHCVWVPKHDQNEPFCTNTYQIRNALVIVFAVVALSIPAWSYVAWKAKQKMNAEEEAGRGTAFSELHTEHGE